MYGQDYCPFMAISIAISGQLVLALMATIIGINYLPFIIAIYYCHSGPYHMPFMASIIPFYYCHSWHECHEYLQCMASIIAHLWPLSLPAVANYYWHLWLLLLTFINCHL